MKKIGIATYIKNFNYGSELQGFALKHVISSLGYDAQLIDFTDLRFPHNKKMKLQFYLSSLGCMLLHPCALPEELNRRKQVGISSAAVTDRKKSVFSEFERQYMAFNTENYRDSSVFDAFVCGSDQIWKLTVPGLHSFYFLRFAPPAKRIAYAPSFGGTSVPAYNQKRLKRYLRSFAVLSVRECSGVKLIEQLTGRKAQQVVDPVLLAGHKFWLETMPALPQRTPYILCYFLDHSIPGEEIAKKLSRTHGYQILWIDGGVPCQLDAETITPSPLEFVSLIAQACCVITDSFHAAAFSIMLNRDFYVVPRAYTVSTEQQTRLTSILEQTGLMERMVSGPFTELPKIDFSIPCKILEEEQKKSERYLQQALEQAVSRQEGCASIG